MQETNKTYNLGYLNGWLSSIARVNDKTNHQFNFRLNKCENTGMSIQERLDAIFNPVCESFELEQLEDPKTYITKAITANWFFEFQRKDLGNNCLVDKKKHFSLSGTNWKQEWIEEFVDLLLHTVSSKDVYHLKIGETKGFYVCASLEIIFVNDQELYHLHLSVSD